MINLLIYALLILILFFLTLRFLLMPKDVGLGYKTFLKGTERGIQKHYADVLVKILHWGSTDQTADGNDVYSGVYCLIVSPREISLSNSRVLFDDFSTENYEGRFFITMQKKGLFIGSPEMKEFLQKFDNALNLDL